MFDILSVKEPHIYWKKKSGRKSLPFLFNVITRRYDHLSNANLSYHNIGFNPIIPLKINIAFHAFDLDMSLAGKGACQNRKILII